MGGYGRTRKGTCGVCLKSLLCRLFSHLQPYIKDRRRFLLTAVNIGKSSSFIEATTVESLIIYVVYIKIETGFQMPHVQVKSHSACSRLFLRERRNHMYDWIDCKDSTFSSNNNSSSSSSEPVLVATT